MKRTCKVTIVLEVVTSGQEPEDRIARDVETAVMTALDAGGYEPVSKGASASYVPRPINREEAGHAEG